MSQVEVETDHKPMEMMLKNHFLKCQPDFKNGHGCAEIPY